MEDQPMRPRCLRAGDAAKYLGCGESHLWGLTRRGELRAIRMTPKLTVWTVEALDAYIDAKLAESQRGEVAA